MPVVDDCEDVSEWVGMFGNETPIPLTTSLDAIEGTYSLLADIVPPAGNYWAYVFKGSAAPDWIADWTNYPLLSFWIKVSNAAKPVTVTIFSGAWAETHYALSGLVSNTWQKFQLDLRQPGTDGSAPPLLSGMIRLRFDYEIAGENTTLQLDDIQTTMPVPRTISGTVVDIETRTPIINVSISTDSYGPIYTLADGIFSLQVSAGIYMITFARSGYKTRKVEVNVTDADATGLLIELTPGVTPPPSPCFIATVAYGSPLAEELTVFRLFRDQFMMTNKIGEYLTKVYYSVGKHIACLIGKSRLSVNVTRHILNRIANTLRRRFKKKRK